MQENPRNKDLGCTKYILGSHSIYIAQGKKVGRAP